MYLALAGITTNDTTLRPTASSIIHVAEFIPNFIIKSYQASYIGYQCEIPLAVWLQSLLKLNIAIKRIITSLKNVIHQGCQAPVRMAAGYSSLYVKWNR